MWRRNDSPILVIPQMLEDRRGGKKRSGQRNVGKNNGVIYEVYRGSRRRVKTLKNLLQSFCCFDLNRAGGYPPTLVHVRSFTWRTYALYAPVFRGREAHSHARFVETNGTEEEQRNRRDGARRMPTRRALTLCAYRSRIEAGATLARIKALQAACP